MKVIDIFNDLADGREIPKKIRKKGYDTIYILNERSYSIDNLYQTEHYTNWINKTIFSLNEEIEVLEEDKEIEEIKWNDKSQYNIATDDTKKTLKILLSRSEQLKKSLNEVIITLNELKKGK